MNNPNPAVGYLVRHARTPLNADGRLRGHLDPDLDTVGRAEARACAEALADALHGARSVRVITSPLQRARHTAEIIAEATGGCVQVDERLIDRDYGPWAGQREDAVVAKWGSLDAAPGVEAAELLVARARETLAESLPAAGGATVVLVAHDAVNRALLAYLDPSLGPPERIRQRTACWNLLRCRDGHWWVDAIDVLAGDAPDRPLAESAATCPLDEDSR